MSREASLLRTAGKGKNNFQGFFALVNRETGVDRENQFSEKKSLKKVSGKTADFSDLAKDCVAFANSKGGIIAVGIEDRADLPPPEQKIDPDLSALIVKRISELTIGTAIKAEIQKSRNNAEYIEVRVFPSEQSLAATTDGKYYYRVYDSSKPLLPDEMIRLLSDKPSFQWDSKPVKTVPRDRCDMQKLTVFLESIKNSERVSLFVKQKTDQELLDHYLMAEGSVLTNLGVLWIGQRNDRARLSYAPVIQFLKYDENENRVNKLVWDDYSLNPAELIDAVWDRRLERRY
jgi:ATP-dependent DNA helicase RecG